MAIKYPYQDPNLDLETRVADLVNRMNVEEKIGLIPTKQEAIERLGVKAYEVGGEAAHGIVMRDGEPGTVFPQTIGLACTWNSELLQQAGAVVGKEARAYYHLLGEQGGLTLWAPTVDLERDPRWGRTEEAYGEDPYLAGSLASAYVQGMQGDDPFYLQIAAALKHFFANNNEQDRGVCSASIDPRNMKEYYWQSFKHVIEKAQVCCVMTAYNEINGTPAILNKDVKNIAKQEWGLPGFVVGDATDFEQIVTLHKYYDNYGEAMADTLKSGVDCLPDEPELVKQSVREALAAGLLTESELDETVKNIMRIRIRLGQFDSVAVNPYANIDPDVICCQEHRDLALLVQQESIVLLKNDNLLPLNKKQKVAVIGPLADKVYLDWYTGHAPYQVSVLQGIKNKLSQAYVSYVTGLDQIALKTQYGQYIAPSEDGVLFANNSYSQQANYEHTDWGWGSHTLKSLATNKYVTTGSKLTATADEVYGWFVRELYDIKSGNMMQTWDGKNVLIDKTDHFLYPSKTTDEASAVEVEVVKDGIAEAVAAAKQADVAIVCLGNHPLINGKEEIDRPDITLPPRQQKLLAAVYAANKNTVLVLVSSYPYAINWAQEHVPAIVYTTNCCQELGNGVADVIFGDYNPAGRLNMTWYRTVSELPDIMDYDIIKGQRTYLYYQGQPLYPFGFGLSYTSFTYDRLQFLANELEASQTLKLSFRVTNTGKIAGDEVAQVYFKSNDQRIRRPNQQLIRFKRVHLQPQESKVIEFDIAISELEFYDVRQEQFCVTTGNYTFLVGSSSADVRLTKMLKVIGVDLLPRDLTKRTKADHFDDYAGVYLHECKEGGTAVCLANDEGWISFHDVQFSKERNTLLVRLAAPTSGGQIQVRKGSPKGTLLGESQVGATGGAQIWSTVSIRLQSCSDVHDLFLVFSGDLKLSWLELG